MTELNEVRACDCRRAGEIALDHLTVLLGFSKILVSSLKDNPRLQSYALQVNRSAKLLHEQLNYSEKPLYKCQGCIPERRTKECGSGS